jgi:sorting and assembly machinery component 37
MFLLSKLFFFKKKMFTLYVWGPNWDLPSIDPGCLTVIVYFQLLVSEEWGIIECNNPNISPTGI